MTDQMMRNLITNMRDGKRLFLVGVRGQHSQKFYCMPIYEQDASAARTKMAEKMDGFNVESVVRVVRWKHAQAAQV